MIGDIVGTPGMRVVRRAVPWLRASEHLDFVIANAENAANGSGLYPSNYKQLRNAGVDAVTLGDHIYKRLEIASLLRSDEPICRPANYPPESLGRDHVLTLTIEGTLVAVISVMGRTFMRPVDCPYRAMDRVLAQVPDNAIVVVDIHAEATADKYLMGHYLNGRVAAVIGTHTHVPTADEQILSGGTAFLCDVGMCGPYEGILGRKVDPVLATAVTFIPHTFEIGTEDVRMAGVIVDVDPATRRATAIRRIMVRECDVPME